MFEKILDNIYGLSALGLFGASLYQWYRSEKEARREAEIMAQSATKRYEIEKSIKELEDAQINAKRNYDEAKGRVNEILNKRNSNSSDNNGSN